MSNNIVSSMLFATLLKATIPFGKRRHKEETLALSLSSTHVLGGVLLAKITSIPKLLNVKNCAIIKNLLKEETNTYRQKKGHRFFLFDKLKAVSEK